ncbi:hypothetical protein ACWEQC_44135 [Streptomyces shenzhenensis]
MRTRFGRGPPGSVDVTVVEQGTDQDRAAVPGPLPLPSVGAQQHERLLPLAPPVRLRRQAAAAASRRRSSPQ